MRWFIREASLVTVLVALVLVLEPTWLAGVSRLWLITISGLGIGALLSEVFRRIPVVPRPANVAWAGEPGAARQMRDIEQANDFLVAVDYQLVPFLQGAVRQIAAQRLLLHHNIHLERQPDRARDLLGEDTWQIVKPGPVAENESSWRTLTLAQLRAVTDSLEQV